MQMPSMEPTELLPTNGRSSSTLHTVTPRSTWKDIPSKNPLQATVSSRTSSRTSPLTIQEQQSRRFVWNFVCTMHPVSSQTSSECTSLSYQKDMGMKSQSFNTTTSTTPPWASPPNPNSPSQEPSSPDRKQVRSTLKQPSMRMISLPRQLRSTTSLRTSDLTAVMLYQTPTRSNCRSLSATDTETQAKLWKSGSECTRAMTSVGQMNSQRVSLSN